MTPKVTICIPVYNCAAFVEKTIKSVLDQTYTDLEIIISDNGSTDGTLDKIKSFKDNRIRIIAHASTILATDNWNNCIENAHGDLIAIYHGDDIYEKDIVEKQVNAFNNNPILGAVFTGAYKIDSNDMKIGSMFIDETLSNNAPIDLNLALLSLMDASKGSLICPSAMIRKDVYQDVGLYEKLPHGLVYNLYFKILEKYPVLIIPEKLMSYRIHGQQDSKKVLIKNLNPNPLFRVINKFLASPSFTAKVPLSLLKSTKMDEKSDLYRCAATAIKNKDIPRANNFIETASRIYPGPVDFLIRSLLRYKMYAAACNLTFLKYGM